MKCNMTKLLAHAMFLSSAAPLLTAIHAQGTGTVRARPNLGTQSKSGFTVCVGTSGNRAQYGSKMSGTTGDVAFTGLPVGTQLLVTVSKPGYTGREQGWTVGTTATNEVSIYLFEGSGGPLCPQASNVAPPPPPSPPPTSTVQISVDPGTSARDGFYVCIGNATNREAYGRAVTTSTGVVNFTGLTSSGMLKATVVKAGYAGAERDWYPTPGQNVSISMPVAMGNPVYTCPGYVPTKQLTVRVLQGGRAVSGAYVCVGASGQLEKIAKTRQTNLAGEVVFPAMPVNEPWGIVAGKSGGGSFAALAAPHRKDTVVTMSLAATSSPLCPGTPPPVDVVVAGTTTTAIAPDVRLAPEVFAARGDELFVSGPTSHSCGKFGSNYVLVGLKVRFSPTIMHAIDLYCAPLQSSGVLGAPVYYPTGVVTNASSQDFRCPAGSAVAGFRGTRDTSSDSPAHLRSLTLYCAKLGSNGLTGTPAQAATALGVNSGSGWGPDICTQGRPARDLNFFTAQTFGAPPTIGSWQLGCAQPVRPQS